MRYKTRANFPEFPNDYPNNEVNFGANLEVPLIPKLILPGKPGPAPKR